MTEFFPLQGVAIEVTFRCAEGRKTYVTSPIDNSPELLSYYLNKFVGEWARDYKYLKEKK